jgi:hypothetical protein
MPRFSVTAFCSAPAKFEQARCPAANRNRRVGVASD